MSRPQTVPIGRLLAGALAAQQQALNEAFGLLARAHGLPEGTTLLGIDADAGLLHVQPPADVPPAEGPAGG